MIWDMIQAMISYVQMSIYILKYDGWDDGWDDALNVINELIWLWIVITFIVGIIVTASASKYDIETRSGYGAIVEAFDDKQAKSQVLMATNTNQWHSSILD